MEYSIQFNTIKFGDRVHISARGFLNICLYGNLKNIFPWNHLSDFITAYQNDKGNDEVRQLFWCGKMATSAYTVIKTIL